MEFHSISACLENLLGFSLIYPKLIHVLGWKIAVMRCAPCDLSTADRSIFRAVSVDPPSKVRALDKKIYKLMETEHIFAQFLESLVVILTVIVFSPNLVGSFLNKRFTSKDTSIFLVLMVIAFMFS